MPILLTYELNGAATDEHNRLQSAFERLGWENLGGSSYRYPRLGTTDQPVEDWLNHVVPSLMLFRAFIIGSSCTLKKFTLDVQSSSGYNKKTSFGSEPISGKNMKSTGTAEKKLYTPTNASFGKKNLIEWLDSIKYPY